MLWLLDKRLVWALSYHVSSVDFLLRAMTFLGRLTVTLCVGRSLGYRCALIRVLRKEC